MFNNTNKSSGQVSRILLILSVIILVAVAISYSVIRFAERPPKTPETTEKIPQPVYEETLGDIRFIFQEAKDFGGVLKGSQSKNPQWQKDLKTTERFIRVKVAAQNKGKENTRNGDWDIKNIIDSEGRNYIPISADQWMPENNYCGDALKPEFEPISCLKFYEVSKISAGLKIIIETKGKTALLDLIVTN